MKTGKATIFFVYFLLVIFWVVLNFSGSRHGWANSLFGLLLGLYSFLFGSVLFLAALKLLDKSVSRLFVSMFSCSICFFGLGTIVWFLYEFLLKVEVPYPSISDIFYSWQFPAVLFGLLVYFYSIQDSGSSVIKLDRKKMIKPIAISAFIMSAILTATYAAALVYGSGSINLETYLTFYFPVESFSVVVASMVLYFKLAKGFKIEKVSWFVFLILGNITWFTADCFFFYEFISGAFFEAGYSDFLYLTGVFLVFVSILEFLEEAFDEDLAFSEDIVYFVKTSLSIPVGLNSKKSKIGIKGLN